MMWVKGKTVLVTGASSGLGLKIAHRLFGVAGNIILVSRTILAKDFPMSASGTKVYVKALDVNDQKALVGFFHWLEYQKLEVDAFVNCAGGTIPAQFESMGPDIMDRILDVNLRAPMHWLRELLPQMKTRGGRVVLVSSRSGERALTRLAPYTVAKAGIEALVAALRNEYARYDIGFTLINPGSVNTNFTRDWLEADREAHNAEAMAVEDAVEPILWALSVPFAINKISYESFEQWKREPGVLR